MQAPLENPRRLGILIAAVFLGSIACGGSVASATPHTPSPTAKPTLTAAEQAELAQLEARPLKLPPMPIDGSCPDGPHSTISPFTDNSETVYVYGLGPTYAKGGPERKGQQNTFFEVTGYTDPTVRGVVLIRGQVLDGSAKVVFVEDYAAGPVVGTDVVQGVQVDVHAEAAFPTAHLPAVAGAAKGWGIWQLNQGIAKDSVNTCIGFQIDTDTTSQVVVGQG